MNKGVFVDGLIEQVICNPRDAYQLIIKGWLNRRVAPTSMNREGSRSHAVFTVKIESKEAGSINKSLSVLWNVIMSLSYGKKRHIPYRNSKLTFLLRDSIGGKTKTRMIACVHPDSSAKQKKNKAVFTWARDKTECCYRTRSPKIEDLNLSFKDYQKIFLQEDSFKKLYAVISKLQQENQNLLEKLNFMNHLEFKDHSCSKPPAVDCISEGEEEEESNLS
nr:kinesin-like protein KIF15 [Biomphalaria glabrata]